jgi:hypothetical protein
MGHKLVHKILKICLWLWCCNCKNWTLKKHRYKKTPFHPFLLIIKKDDLWNLKLLYLNQLQWIVVIRINLKFMLYKSLQFFWISWQISSNCQTYISNKTTKKLGKQKSDKIIFNCNICGSIQSLFYTIFAKFILLIYFL